MKKITYLMSIVGLLFALTGCKKDAGPAKNEPAAPVQAAQGKVAIKLMGTGCTSIQINNPNEVSPNKAQAITGVNVDIQRVMIYSESKGWVDMKLMPGVYDLMALQNDVSIYLTTQTNIDAGEFKYLYVFFGGENSLMINDQKKCMRLKVNALTVDMAAMIKSGMLSEILIGFDFCDAISVDANYNNDGCYILDPRIIVKGYSDISL
jgi:hypothetical protein